MVAALIISALCQACPRQDDESRIRALIAEGAAAAETHDTSAILDLAIAEVRAMPMDLDRRGIKAVLWRTFNYYGPMRILYPRPVVEVSDAADAASTSFPFLLLKKEQPFPAMENLRDDPAAWIKAIGDAADLYLIRLQWIKQGGDWLVDRVYLQRYTGGAFGE